MNSTHHLPVPLPDHGKQTAIFCSVGESRNLVVFVHGFGGKSQKTWSAFESLLLPQGLNADIIFYGYHGFLEHIQPNAGLLDETIDEIASRPTRFLATHAPHVVRGPGWRGYDRIVLVAHSMGAIVSRRALLVALKAKRKWVEQVRLVLFAPAHTGVDDVIGLLLGIRDPFGIGAIASGGIKIVSPALRDLLKASTFEKLAAETRAERQRNKRRSRCLVAARVVFGSAETVVSMEPFGEDPEPVSLRGKGHFSVCKPTAQFRRPVEIVAAELV
jgi:pimeloyl-ACP methyl ester carboxylesterase